MLTGKVRNTVLLVRLTTVITLPTVAVAYRNRSNGSTTIVSPGAERETDREIVAEQGSTGTV